VNLDLWLAFVLAAEALLIIPGPTIILVISQSMAHGRRAVLPLAAGVTLGDFTAMALSLLGTTFLGLAAINATLYGLFAGHLRDALQSAKVRRSFNLCAGSALFGAGIATATLQRAP